VNRRLLAIATTAALAAVVAVAPARGATVSLRVDSSTDPVPLFDGTLTTLPHVVDGGDGSGPHPCGRPGATPAATATGALDDAMRSAGIPWRGNWEPSFRDFFVDRIGAFASAAPDRYWSLTVNDRFASGGCLARVEDGDSIHFSYGPLFGDPPPTDPGGAAGGSGPRGENGAPSPASGPSSKGTRGIAARAARYLRRHPGGAGAAWGRLALALRAGRGYARAAADLVEGRLGDLHDGSLGEDVNATALAVLALADRRPGAASQATDWLVSVQDPGGGFGFQPGAAPDVDTTGLATWALARGGRPGPARRGGAFVRSAQGDDGGFPALPGGSSNAQSTGLALVALRVSGVGPRIRSAADGTPLIFLSSLARPDGAIAYGPSSNPTPVWTTAQALLGLTGRAKLIGMDTLPQDDLRPENGRENQAAQGRGRECAPHMTDRGHRDAPVCSGRQ
jgi:Prenyltransferase and squalene oxidase repeat